MNYTLPPDSNYTIDYGDKDSDTGFKVRYREKALCSWKKTLTLAVREAWKHYYAKIAAEDKKIMDLEQEIADIKEIEKQANIKLLKHLLKDALVVRTGDKLAGWSECRWGFIHDYVNLLVDRYGYDLKELCNEFKELRSNVTVTDLDEVDVSKLK